MAERYGAHSYSNLQVGDYARLHAGDVYGDVHHHHGGDNRRFMLLQWLGAPDHTSIHNRARKKHEEGTGQWLLQDRCYKSWLAGDVRLLWLHGKAGCCKTVLCSMIVNDLKEQFSAGRHRVLLFFYFTFADTAKQSYQSLLLSFISQLLNKRVEYAVLSEAYCNNERDADALENVLWKLLDNCGLVDIVVDALDECPIEDDQRNEIVHGLQKLLEKCANVRMLITSRKEPDIENALCFLNAVSMPVPSGPVNEDIKTHVMRELERDPKLKVLDSSMKAKIKLTILSKCGGMFRWVFCQLQQIKKIKIWTDEYLDTTLGSLPPTLNETYDRILLSIDQMYEDVAKHALQWLAFSDKSLHLAELVEVCITNTQHQPYVREDLRNQFEEIVALLSALVEFAVTPEGATTQNIVLAHSSVKDYLVSSRLKTSNVPGLQRFALDEAKGAYTQSQCSLAYIIYIAEHCKSLLKCRCEGFEESKDQAGMVEGLMWSEYPALRDRFPLIGRVVKWYIYQRRAESTDTMIKPGLEIHLLQDDFLRAMWCSLQQFHPYFERNDIEKKISANPLSMACFFELPRTVARLCSIEPKRIITVALEIAISNKQESIVYLLLGYGADLLVQSHESAALLYRLSTKHDEHFVELLIRAGADANIRAGPWSETPLEGALAWHGSLHRDSYELESAKRTLKWLLDAGADTRVMPRRFIDHKEIALFLRSYAPETFSFTLPSSRQTEFSDYRWNIFVQGGR